DRFLETCRGCGRSEMTGVIDENRDAGWHRHATDASDKCVSMSLSCANANPSRFAGHASVADINIITASSQIKTGIIAQSDVAAPGGIVFERVHTIGRVVVADIFKKRQITGGCIAAAG